MCWSVPGRIKNIAGNTATVDIGGITKNVMLDLIEKPTVGEYVVIHAGYAIQKVDEDAARFTMDILGGKYGK